MLANKCFLSEEKEELDTICLFIAKALGCFGIFCWAIVGSSWVFPLTMCQTLLSWQGAHVGKKRKKIWLATPLCLFWILWRERNRVTFENKVPLYS